MVLESRGGLDPCSVGPLTGEGPIDEVGHRMEWVREYYTEQSRSFGRAGVTDYHRTTAETLSRLGGGSGLRALELGCGNGALAAAMTDLGHSVVAVELNPADVELARQLEQQGTGALELIEADFYELCLDQSFDLIYYWDGFGVGSDTDQRRLLDRIGSECLRPAGVALIDVFCPYSWMARAGETQVRTARDGSKWRQTSGFDVLRSRMLDTWQCLDRPQVQRTQSLRCYSPAELELLVGPTQLRIERVTDYQGGPIRGASGDAHLRTTTSFLAHLRPRTTG